MIYPSKTILMFLMILLTSIYSCTSNKNHSVDIYGAFYSQETLYIEINGELKFQKIFTKKPMEMCNVMLNHGLDDDSLTYHIYTKYSNKTIIDTIIKSANTESKYHLIFSNPFFKKNGEILDSERTPPIDSSFRIVNYIKEDTNWNDIRK